MFCVRYDNTNVLISVDVYSDFGMGGKGSYKCLCRLQYGLQYSFLTAELYCEYKSGSFLFV